MDETSCAAGLRTQNTQAKSTTLKISHISVSAENFFVTICQQRRHDRSYKMQDFTNYNFGHFEWLGSLKTKQKKPLLVFKSNICEDMVSAFAQVDWTRQGIQQLSADVVQRKTNKQNLQFNFNLNKNPNCYVVKLWQMLIMFLTEHWLLNWYKYKASILFFFKVIVCILKKETFKVDRTYCMFPEFYRSGNDWCEIQASFSFVANFCNHNFLFFFFN